MFIIDTYFLPFYCRHFKHTQKQKQYHSEPSWVPHGALTIIIAHGKSYYIYLYYKIENKLDVQFQGTAEVWYDIHWIEFGGH